MRLPFCLVSLLQEVKEEEAKEEKEKKIPMVLMVNDFNAAFASPTSICGVNVLSKVRKEEEKEKAASWLLISSVLQLFGRLILRRRC